MGSNRFIFIILSLAHAATPGNARPAYEGVFARCYECVKGLRIGTFQKQLLFILSSYSNKSGGQPYILVAVGSGTHQHHEKKANDPFPPYFTNAITMTGIIPKNMLCNILTQLCPKLGR